MERKHTPGPWEVSKDGTPDYAPQYTVYAEATGNRVATAFDTEANAALIAAAPDMYEALQALQAGFRDGEIAFTRKRQADSDPYHPANTAMCAALAKAEGK